MLCRRCGLCSRTNRKLNIVSGEGGKCHQDAQKFNFTTKCLNTFVAHCSFPSHKMLLIVLAPRPRRSVTITVHKGSFWPMTSPTERRTTTSWIGWALSSITPANRTFKGFWWPTTAGLMNETARFQRQRARNSPGNTACVMPRSTPCKAQRLTRSSSCSFKISWATQAHKGKWGKKRQFAKTLRQDNAASKLNETKNCS